MSVPQWQFKNSTVAQVKMYQTEHAQQIERIRLSSWQRLIKRKMFVGIYWENSTIKVDCWGEMVFFVIFHLANILDSTSSKMDAPTTVRINKH